MEPRELAYADWINGMKPGQIAKKHGISVNTVKSWVTRHWKGETGAPKRRVQTHPTKQKDAPAKREKANPVPLDKQLADAVDGNEELTAQQRDFCLYFNRIKNATQAYYKAYGCSYNTARTEGSRLLTNPNIKDELRRLREITIASLEGLCGEDIVALHMRIAFADITDYVEFGTKRVPVISKGEVVMMENPKTGDRLPMTQTINVVRLLDGANVDGQIITEVSEGREGAKIKLVDRQRSIAFLERFFELNPNDRHRREFDEQRLELERKRTEAAIRQSGDNSITRGQSVGLLAEFYRVINDALNPREQSEGIKSSLFSGLIESDPSTAESKVKPLSRKAINSISETGYLNVWEGAVRSSKTVVSSLAWIDYVTKSPEQYFIMSGKTISSLYRNVIGGEYGVLAMLGPSGEYKVDREGNRVLIMRTPEGDKTCYCFGANDERSYTTLRGLTVGGWYADEVNLQPRSFIDEALKRTIISSDRKHFWTLNPDTPNHFIYKDFIDKYEQEELPGFYLWHFTLEDNQAMPPDRKDELKAQYSGLFYRRYILGERCIAEGVIFDSFNEENLYDDGDRPENLEHLAQRTIAVDYGTTNPCVYLDVYDDGETLWVDNEYRWDSKSDEAKKAPRAQKTDAEYAVDMERFMGSEYRCEIVCDPSAASFITELKTRLMFVTPGDNDVLNGIRVVSTLFSKRAIKIHRNRCQGLVQEIRTYIWNEKAALYGEEKPVKLFDHGPDALRYFCYTKLPGWRIGMEKENEEAA